MTVHGSWTLDRLVEAYTQHQRRTRGLRPQTLRDRARLVRILIRAALGTDPVEPARLAPADVVVFITSVQGRFSPGSMRTVRSTLRSFFGSCASRDSVATSSRLPSQQLPTGGVRLCLVP